MTNLITVTAKIGKCIYHIEMEQKSSYAEMLTEVENALEIKNKPIIQREKGGLYIKTFNSAYEASKELNINRKSIGNVLAKRAKLAGGFNWTYN